MSYSKLAHVFMSMPFSEHFCCLWQITKLIWNPVSLYAKKSECNCNCGCSWI